jgi:hypothetical protein
MITWEAIVEVDTRVGILADVALVALIEGDRNQDFPDAVYTAAKPYLWALLNNCPPPTGTSGRYGWSFDGVLKLPRRHRTEQAQALMEERRAFEVACTHIHDRLCDAYDRRERGMTA